jgi:anti-sigma regulatory factor (Ser/Thr protein kinase)
VSPLFAGVDPEAQTRVIPVPDASHIGEARRAVATLSSLLGLDETSAGRVAIVATELATNLANHGGGGTLLARTLASGTGIELIAIDRGRGIDDVGRALRDGYSSGGTAGKGLGAVHRMSDVFDLYSQPGHGTAVLARMLRLVRSSPPATAGDLLELGAVSVPAPNETVCGDGWAVVQGELGPSIIVIDGLGHGVLAHEAASVGLEICRRNPGAPPAAMLEAMHRGMRATRGAAAAVAEINPSALNVRFAGIGNVACSVASTEGSRSIASMSGIVGHEARRVQEFAVSFPAGASLVMFSDGLTTRWRLDQYPGLRPRHPALGAAVAFRDHTRGRDDATVLVARLAAPRREGDTA